jgi:predicted ATPase
VQKSRGQIVGIVGEPGIGKSRLLHEFLRAELAPTWTVLATGAVAGGGRGAYAPIVQLLRSWIDATDQDTPEELKSKAEAVLEPLVGQMPQHRAALLALLDVPTAEDSGWQALTPMQRRRATLEAVKALCIGESQRQPLALVVEDLHWLDEQTQASLDLLADGIAGARVLLLVTYRPEYRHRWMGRSHFSQLRLDPLSPEETGDLLAALLGHRPGLEPIRRSVAERAEGTPLFLEEAVRSLIEAGALAGSAGDYAPLRVVDELELPATLQAVLAARIDRLPPSSKRLLHIASVIGRDLPLGLLQRVAGLSPDELEATLAELQAAELLFETRLAPDRGYSFKHALTHEVAYGSLLRERRRALHAELARAIEELHPTPTADQVERLAHHAAAGELWEPAARYLFPAAARAAQRSAHRRAAQLLQLGLDALTHLPETPERSRRELDYQNMLAVTMMAMKGWGAVEVADAYERAHQLCKELGDSHELFTVLRGQGQFHMIRGELTVARALGEQCMALTNASEDVGQRIETHHLFWSNSFFMGDYASVEQHAGQGMALYTRDPHHALTYIYSGHDPGVCCRSFSSLVLWQRGLVDMATERGREALRLARQVNHPLTLALAYWGLSYLHLLRREPGEARRWAEQEIAVCEHYGLPLLLSQGLFQLGWALAEEGHGEPGLAKMQEGLAAIRATGAEMGLPYFMALLGQASGRAGQIDEGLAQIEGALETASRHGAAFQLPEMLRLKGELMLASPGADLEGAERCFRSAVEAARQQGARLPELRAATSLARLLRGRGETARMRQLLMPLLAGFSSGFETTDLHEAQSLLD